MIEKIIKKLIGKKFNFLKNLLNRRSLFSSYFGINNKLDNNSFNKNYVVLNFSKILLVYNYFLLHFYRLLINFNNRVFCLVLLSYINYFPCVIVLKKKNLFNLSQVNFKFYFKYLNKYYNILKFLKYKYISNVFTVYSNNDFLIFYLFFYYKRYFTNLSFLFYYKFFILLQSYFFNIVWIKQGIKQNFYREKNVMNTGFFEKKIFLNSILSKNVIYTYLKNLKVNPVVLFLYNDFFFKKETYKIYYLNNSIFQFLKKKLTVCIPNYYFFFSNFLNLLNLKKYNTNRLIDFQKTEKIYNLNNFSFIQNFELSLYTKNEVKNIYNYIGHFVDRTLFNLDQYLSMLDENLFLYIDILLDTKKLKIRDISEDVKIKDVDLYLNFDKLFFFFVENGLFYINYYLLYFIYTIFNYLNFIQLNSFKFISTNEIFTYVEKSMMSYFKLYYLLLFENYNFFNTSFSVYFLYNKDFLFRANILYDDNAQNDILNMSISDYAVFYNLNYYVMNKNYLNNKPDFVDQQIYNFMRFEQKNFYLSDLKLIDNCFKVYFDINILNNYKYVQKYKLKSKNEMNFNFKNAYFLTADVLESEQQYAEHYEFHKVDKNMLAKFNPLNENKFFSLKEMPHELSAMHFINFNEYYGMNIKGNNWALLEAVRFDIFCNYFIYINKIFILEFILLHEYNLQCPSIYKMGPISSEYLFEAVSLKDKFFYFFFKLYNFILNPENFESYYFNFFGFKICYGFYFQFFFFFPFFFFNKLINWKQYFYVRNVLIPFSEQFHLFEILRDELSILDQYDSLLFLDFADYDNFINRQAFWTDSIFNSFGFNSFLQEFDNKYLVNQSYRSYIFYYSTFEFFFLYLYLEFFRDVCYVALIRYINFIYLFFFKPIFLFVKNFFKCLFLVIEFILFCFFLSLYICKILLYYGFFYLYKFFVFLSNFIINCFERYKIFDYLFIIIFLYVSFFEIFRYIVIKIYIYFFHQLFLKIGLYIKNFYKRYNDLLFYYLFKFLKIVGILLSKVLLIYMICIGIFLNYDRIICFFEYYLYLKISYHAIFIFYSVMLFLLIMWLLWPLKMANILWELRYILLILLLCLWYLATLVNSIDLFFTNLWDKHFFFMSKYAVSYINFYYKFINDLVLLEAWKMSKSQMVMLDFGLYNWFNIYFPGFLKYFYLFSGEVDLIFNKYINYIINYTNSAIFNSVINNFILYYPVLKGLVLNFFNETVFIYWLTIYKNSFFYYYYYIFIFLYFEQYGFLPRLLYTSDFKGIERAYYDLIINYNIDPMIAYNLRFMYYTNMFNLSRRTLWGNYNSSAKNFFEFYAYNWRIKEEKKYKIFLTQTFEKKKIGKFYNNLLKRRYNATELYFLDLYKYETFRGLEHYDYNNKSNLLKTKYEYNLISFWKKLSTSRYNLHENLLINYKAYRQSEFFKYNFFFTEQQSKKAKALFAYNPQEAFIATKMQKKVPHYRWNIVSHQKFYGSRLYHYNYLIPDFGFLGSKTWGTSWVYLNADQVGIRNAFLGDEERYHRY